MISLNFSYNSSGSINNIDLREGKENCRHRFRVALQEGLFNEIGKNSSNEIAIRNFIEGSDFDQFYHETIEIFNKLTELDVSSLDKDLKTPLAKRFIHLFETLETNGFDSLKGREIHFWSGKTAKVIMSYPGKRIIDTKIPVFAAIHLINQTIHTILSANQNQFENSRHRFIQAVSLYLANQAHGDVKVFISNDGKEVSDSLTAGNYFWDVEFPVLRKLKENHTVTNISLFFYDESANYGWAQPIDVSKRLEFNILRIVRKYDDGKGTTIGKLRNIIRKWKNYKR